MDKFIYTAHLHEINKESSKRKLIKLMSNYSLTSTKNKRAFISPTYRVPEFRNRNKEQMINSIYNYMLFVEVRKRYLNLGFNITELPKYAQFPPFIFNIDETIKQIKESNEIN